MTRRRKILWHKDLRLSIEQLEQRRMLASDPYTIVQLPDTQSLVGSSPNAFDAQAQWVANHVESDNIVFLSHVGDLVQNPAIELEWQRADAAMSILDGDPITDPDGLLPYSAAIGNHDFDDDNTHLGATQFSQYFGAARYADKSWYGGSSADQLNHFQLFSADDQQFLHLTMEWEPRDSAIVWAQGILDAYADVPTLLTTHAYLDETGGHSDEQLTSDGRSGLDVFQDLVSPNPQIFMVLGGHFGPERHQVSLNSLGSEIIEILANYQGRPAGEDGFLRLIEFDPSVNLVNFTTYSPTLDLFETDANSQFSLNLDFQQRFDLPAPPRARLVQPRDNDLTDLDASTHSVKVNTAQPSLEISLLDFSSGMDAATVTSSTLSLTKDGVQLNEAADFTFMVDAVLDRITLVPMTGSFGNGTYEVSLNSGAAKIADNAGNALAPVSLILEIDTSIPNRPDSLYFSLNKTAILAGGITLENEDVAFFDGQEFSQFFDGSDVGLSGFAIDALDITAENELLLSLTGSGSIPGISGTVDDSDILKFTATEWGETTTGSFELFFDGSDVGLTSSGEDIDSIDLLEDGRLLVSTRSTFNVGTVTGGDEDVIAFTATSLGSSTAGTWEMFFDGSDVGLEAEDVNSVSLYPNGDIYLSTADSFAFVDSTIRDDDVFVFSPTTSGENTVGNYAASLFVDGNLHGLSPYDVMAVHVPTSAASPNQLNALDDFTSLAEGATTTLLIDGSLSLLDNDLPNGALTAITPPLSAPVYGTVILNTDGTFSYTHDGSENFSDSFTYEVQDSTGATDAATVSISITPVNDNPPIAGDDSILVSQGATATQLIGGSDSLAANDADLDLPNDLLTVNTIPVTLPAHGTLMINADGTFSYTHNGSANMVDSFVYEIADATNTTSTATVTISVTTANNAPTANDSSVTTEEDATYSFSPNEFNFVDADGDSLLQIQITALETAGSLQLSGGDVVLGQVLTATEIAASDLEYLPAPNANGANYDLFRFKVHDGTEFSVTDYAMTLDVTAVNDLPILAGLPDVSFVENGSDSTIDLDNFYADVETAAAAATFSVLSSFPGVTTLIDPVSHVLTVIGDLDFTGEGDITIQVTDTGDGSSAALSDTETLHLSISPSLGDSVLLLGFDRATTVGTVTAADEDILIFDGLNFSRLFDGSDVGVGAGRLNGFDLISPNELLLSFTAPLTVPGIIDVVDDSDIIKFTGTQFGEVTQGTFELYFDGSDVGLDGSGSDIDAFEQLSDGRLLVSITGSDSVLGLSVRDDDLIALTPMSLGDTTSGTWEMFFDGSDVGLSVEDVHGVSLDAGGNIYFAVQNEFIVGGASGDDEDVFVFTPSTLGVSTSGTFSSTLFFDGSLHGISAAELSDIEITTTSSLPPLSIEAVQAVALTVPLQVESSRLEPMPQERRSLAKRTNAWLDNRTIDNASIDHVFETYHSGRFSRYAQQEEVQPQNAEWSRNQPRHGRSFRAKLVESALKIEWQ